METCSQTDLDAAQGIANRIGWTNGITVQRIAETYAAHRRQSQEPLMEVLREARAELWKIERNEDAEYSRDLAKALGDKLDTILSGEVDRG